MTDKRCPRRGLVPPTKDMEVRATPAERLHIADTEPSGDNTAGSVVAMPAEGPRSSDNSVRVKCQVCGGPSTAADVGHPLVCHPCFTLFRTSPEHRRWKHAGDPLSETAIAWWATRMFKERSTHGTN